MCMYVHIHAYICIWIYMHICRLHIYIYIYIYIYDKLSQNAISEKEIGLLCQHQICRCFEKELFAYVYMPCIHIYEELFSKTRPLNLTLTLQTQSLDWRLLSFGKELFIHMKSYFLKCVKRH